MAIYHLHIKSISRSAGRSAPAAAAYRAGERIRDERTGVLHNYSRRRDVLHSEILLPSQWIGSEPHWARERSTLWNVAEAAEHRRDSRVAREIQVTLPVELSAAQRLQLSRTFSKELADRHNVVVDLAVHTPRPEGDPRNYHAHLLATTREPTATGLGAKTGLDMHSVDRINRGLGSGLNEIFAIRARWATLVNDAYRTAGIEERVDHRSLKAQGVDREPVPYIPYVAYKLERRGLRSEVAERIREQHRARVAARTTMHQSTDPASSASAPLANAVSEVEQLRQRARAAWLTLRGEALQSGTLERAATLSRDQTRAKLGAQPASASELGSEAADPDLGL